MADWTLRRAKMDDAARLTEAFRAAYAPFLTAIPNLPDITGGLAQDIATREVWVVEQGQALVGGIVLHQELDMLVIENLAVDPTFGGQGIGEALLDKAAHEARKLGLPKLQLCTHQDMTATIRFYTLRGWQEIDCEGVKVFLEKPI